jgi:CBS domain containing-hemolysin-like protein
MINFFWLLLAFSLVLLNAFFVAAEFGMVKLRHTRVQAIQEIYGLRGRILEQIHRNLDAYLSACQLGITLASLGLGWVGEPAVAKLLLPFFSFIGIQSTKIVTIISFVTAFSLLSLVHIIVGELMPKSLAIRQAEAVSIWTAVPLYLFYWLMYPAIWFLNTCSNFLLKKSGVDISTKNEHYYSTDELKIILNASHLHGELSEEETEILEHTLELADLQVTEVMRPRDDMIILDLNEPVADLIQKMFEHRYTRYPVYDPKKNSIVGLIHVKDLLPVIFKNQSIESLEPYLRPILKVQDRLPAIDLLHKFREGMTHFALVYEGKTHLLGFVTLDNLLHVLIGRIRDEFHRTQDDWVKNADDSFTVKGECSIYSLERALDQEITVSPEEEDMDTLAGLIVARAGILPNVGDKIIFDEFEAIIEKIDGSFIRTVKVVPKN